MIHIKLFFTIIDLLKCMKILTNVASQQNNINVKQFVNSTLKNFNT